MTQSHVIRFAPTCKPFDHHNLNFQSGETTSLGRITSTLAANLSPPEPSFLVGSFQKEHRIGPSTRFLCAIASSERVAVEGKRQQHRTGGYVARKPQAESLIDRVRSSFGSVSTQSDWAIHWRAFKRSRVRTLIAWEIPWSDLLLLLRCSTQRVRGFTSRVHSLRVLRSSSLRLQVCFAVLRSTSRV